MRKISLPPFAEKSWLQEKYKGQERILRIQCADKSHDHAHVFAVGFLYYSFGISL